MKLDPLQGMMLVIVFSLMLGLGAVLTPAKFMETLKDKDGKWNLKPVLIGLLCQVVLMPLLAFSIAKMFNVSDEQGLSMVMIGATPGGSTSNLFTYYSYSDLALSITMTTISNLLALGTLPFNIWLYGREFPVPQAGSDDTSTAEIPFLYIVVTVFVTVILPVSLGLLVRQKSPTWAERCETFSKYVGIIFILVAIVYGLVDNKEILSMGWKFWVSAIFMLPLGSGLGYAFSRFSGLEADQSRTVALETGIQNTTLTLLIIVLNYPRGNAAEKKLQDDLVAFPLMFSLFLVLTAAILTMFFAVTASPEDKAKHRPAYKSSEDATKAGGSASQEAKPATQEMELAGKDLGNTL